MLNQWTRLSLYTSIGLTLLAVLFPRFNIVGGLDEYGFIVSGPPSVDAAIAQANAMFGSDAPRLTGGIHFSIDFVHLLVELAMIWGIYFALKRAVLRPATN